jgi:hypothetical protein
VHEQDNSKIQITESGQKRIADEKGINTYTKVDSSRCEFARKWWSDNKSVWHVIQGMWAHLSSHHPLIQLKGTVAGKTLWMALFELAETYQKEFETTGQLNEKALKKASHDLIHLFLIE